MTSAAAKQKAFEMINTIYQQLPIELPGSGKYLNNATLWHYAKKRAASTVNEILQAINTIGDPQWFDTAKKEWQQVLENIKIS